MFKNGFEQAAVRAAEELQRQTRLRKAAQQSSRNHCSLRLVPLRAVTRPFIERDSQIMPLWGGGEASPSTFGSAAQQQAPVTVRPVTWRFRGCKTKTRIHIMESREDANIKEASLWIHMGLQGHSECWMR